MTYYVLISNLPHFLIPCCFSGLLAVPQTLQAHVYLRAFVLPVLAFEKDLYPASLFASSLPSLKSLLVCHHIKEAFIGHLQEQLLSPLSLLRLIFLFIITSQCSIIFYYLFMSLCPTPPPKI